MGTSKLMMLITEIPDCSRVDWKKIADVLGGHAPSKSSFVYTNLSTSSLSTPTAVIICFAESSGPSLCPQTLVQRLEPTLGSSIRGRHYQSLTPELTPFDGQQPHFLVTNAMTPIPTAEQSFNSWYTEEHIPLLSRVPSWLSSRRFILLSATDEAPLYLALHQWGDLAAFGTAEYESATHTSWRTEVIEQVAVKERFVLEYRGTLESMINALKDANITL